MKRIGAQSLAIVCTLWALTGCDAVFGFEERPFVPSPGTGGTGAGGGSTTMVGVGGGGGNATATGGSGAGGQTTTASGGAGGGAPLFDKSFVFLKQTFKDNQIGDGSIEWRFSARFMVSSLDPLPTTARAFIAARCWDAQQQELCTGSGFESEPITDKSPTDQWLAREIKTKLPEGTSKLEFVLQLNHCDKGACSDVGGTIYWDDVRLLHNMMSPEYLKGGDFESEIFWVPVVETEPPDDDDTIDSYSNYGLIAHGDPLKASANPNNLTFDGYMMSQGLWMRSHFAPSP